MCEYDTIKIEEKLVRIELKCLLGGSMNISTYNKYYITLFIRPRRPSNLINDKVARLSEFSRNLIKFRDLKFMF